MRGHFVENGFQKPGIVEEVIASSPLLDLVMSRRSATLLTEPGPSREQLERILLAAGTVPDHGLLRPYRFVVAEGEGRARFGDALASVAAGRRPDAPPTLFEKVRAKAFRSPALVVLVASPKPGKIEIWEQNATAACAGYALVLAAHALGVGAVWKSVPFTKGPALTEALGLSETEEMLGWVHLGTEARPDARSGAAARAPLDLGAAVTVLDGTSRKGW